MELNTSILKFSEGYFFEAKEVAEDNLVLQEEYLYTFVNCLSILAHSAIIWTIIRCKSIQTKTRIFIATWSITDIVFLVFNSSMYRFYSRIHENLQVYDFYCLFSQLEYLLMSLKATFVLMLHSNFAFERINFKTYKYTVLSCCGIFTVLALISGCYCSNEIYNGFPILLHILTFSILFGTFIFKAVYFIRHTKNLSEAKFNFKLILTSTYVLSWFISWLCLVIDVCLESSHYSEVFVFATTAGNVLGYGNGMVNLLLMIVFDKHFNKAIPYALKCKDVPFSVGNTAEGEERAWLSTQTA